MFCFVIGFGVFWLAKLLQIGKTLKLAKLKKKCYISHQLG